MARKRSHYIHGSASGEQARLSKLNDILNAGYIGAVDPRPGERILDLGSGLGQFTRMMAERAAGPPRRRQGGTVRRASAPPRRREPAQVVAIERDARQIAAAKKYLRGTDQQDRIEFRRGDVTGPVLADGEWGSFDLAHTRFLLEHLPDPGGIVKMMARAVRPGGRVFISDDDHDVFRLTPEPEGFARLWKAYVRSYTMMGNDPYVGRKLVGFMREAGLDPVRNGGLFFGGCAGEEHFGAIADNLIGILAGAGGTVIREGLISAGDYARAMKSLRAWKNHPSAAQWYVLYWSEGIRTTGGRRRP